MSLSPPPPLPLNQPPIQNPPLSFPLHSTPRTWLITSGTSPIGIAVARAALTHGDNVVLGVPPSLLSRHAGKRRWRKRRQVAVDGGLDGDGADSGNEDDNGAMEKERKPVHTSKRRKMVIKGEVEDVRNVGLRAQAVMATKGDIEGERERMEEFRAFWEGEVWSEDGDHDEHGDENEEKASWRDRCDIVGLDGRTMAQFQAAVAQAIIEFERVDILFCCSSEALIGAVEELASDNSTRTLVREQIETNFFGPVSCIKAVLPAMRKQDSGHVIALTGITGHLGTPGLGTYCAAGWALEGFCDTLAYEVAPFNIKVTIVQPNLEISVLTNKITAAPSLPQYTQEENSAPLCRAILGGLLDRIQDGENMGGERSQRFASPTVSSVYPRLPKDMKAQLLAETVHAIAAIAGHENPPARHIVGFEGVASVKEKLKTVSEELEDFVEISCAVDIDEGDVANGFNGIPAGGDD